jgi:hypothetical protein
MPLWRPTHQFTKSLRDFLRSILRLAFGLRGLPPPAPRMPFVIRIGAAGPLQLHREKGGLSRAAKAILSALKTYADESANPRFHQRVFSGGSAPPPAQLRMVCQLAAGFDQMASSAALSIGYKLHVALPGSRAAFRHDIQRNLPSETQAVALEREPGLIGLKDVGSAAGSLPQVAVARVEPDRTLDPVSEFEQLLENADRVLELDRGDESSDWSPFALADYAQAGSIILDHSDVVLVAMHDEPHPTFGGTRWIEQRAAEKDLTVIRVPVERPFDALLMWTTDGRREYRRLFEEDRQEINPHVFAAALDDRLLGPPFDLSESRLGWVERRMTAQLDSGYNAKEWDKRWQLASSDALATHDLGRAPQQIDNDLKPAKVWADHRASAMAELVRGSFIVSALLGVVAVLGALLGILFPALPALGYAGKTLELIFLIAIFWTIWRSRRYDWRSQWLSLRQLERYIEQAAWLLLLGRGRIYPTPSHLARFQTDDIAMWTNAYFRALIRNCSFPTVRFTPDYLKTVHALVLQNLVVDQISYFEDEVHFQQKSDQVLERWIKACVLVAAAATVGYLAYAVADLVLPPRLQMPHQIGETTLANIVGVVGALLTAAAAALAAMRNHGEYAQIAARYEGTWEALRGIQSQLAARLPNDQPDFSPPPLRSAALASIVGDATDNLIQEVQGWRAILRKKEIEPT